MRVKEEVNQNIQSPSQFKIKNSNAQQPIKYHKQFPRKSRKNRKTETLKKGINYNACINALNHIQKSIRNSKSKRKRATNSNQKTFNSERRRSQNDKMPSQLNQNPLNIENNSNIVRLIQEDKRLQIPPHKYDSSSQGSHEIGPQSLSSPSSFFPNSTQVAITKKIKSLHSDKSNATARLIRK